MQNWLRGSVTKIHIEKIGADSFRGIYMISGSAS